MTALGLGLIAALCWGIHDVTIRRLSQSTPLMATLLGVLVVGAVFQIAVMALQGGFAPVPRAALLYAIGAGAGFLLASVTLYNAFHRGPVRLVAPIIGSYPVLSVAAAGALGAEITALHWVAVLAVVIGIAVVSIFAHDTGEPVPPIGPTIALAAASAFGFFATFALGHEAAKLASDLPTILITRLTAVALLLPAFALFALPLWPGRSALPVIAILGVLDGIALLAVLSAGGLPSAQYAAVAAATFGMITIVLARLFLQEPMTRAQWGGCALAFGGIGYLAI